MLVLHRALQRRKRDIEAWSGVVVRLQIEPLLPGGEITAQRGFFVELLAQQRVEHLLGMGQGDLTREGRPCVHIGDERADYRYEQRDAEHGRRGECCTTHAARKRGPIQRSNVPSKKIAHVEFWKGPATDALKCGSAGAGVCASSVRRRRTFMGRHAVPNGGFALVGSGFIGRYGTNYYCALLRTSPRAAVPARRSRASGPRYRYHRRKCR